MEDAQDARDRAWWGQVGSHNKHRLKSLVEKPGNPDALTMSYNAQHDGWDILCGDGTRLGHTMLGYAQVLVEFPGKTQTECIRAMMANPSNWVPAT